MLVFKVNNCFHNFVVIAPTEYRAKEMVMQFCINNQIPCIKDIDKYFSIELIGGSSLGERIVLNDIPKYDFVYEEQEE